MTTMTPCGQHLGQRVGDLCVSRSCTCGRRAKTSTRPRQLRQSGDPSFFAGDVADVRDTVKGNQVVLTQRVDLDVLDQHHLVVPEVERGGEHVCRRSCADRTTVSGTCGPLGQGVSRKPVAVGVFADRDQQLTDGCCGAVVVVGPASRLSRAAKSGRPLALLSDPGGSASSRPPRRCSLGDVSAEDSLRLRTGPRSDTGRSSEDSQTGRCCRLRSGAKISATSSLVQRLAIEQLDDRGVEHVPVLLQDLVGLLVGGLDQHAHFCVDDLGHLLAVVALVAHVTSEEDLTLALTEA